MDKIKLIKTETEDPLRKIIDYFEVEIKEEEEIFHIMIKTEEEVATVIGRHGETISAIQKILEVILYKKLGQSIDILVNVNDYREKQKERLESLASHLADKANSSKQPVYFRGLSSYERKIIHQYITDKHPNLATYSIGEGKERQLVVELKNESKKSKG